MKNEVFRRKALVAGMLVMFLFLTVQYLPAVKVMCSGISGCGGRCYCVGFIWQQTGPCSFRCKDDEGNVSVCDDWGMGCVRVYEI